MNYELALKLKKAGFPQEGKGETRAPLEDPIFNEVYIPTLSELIEACGNKFQALHKFQTTFQACGGNYKGIDFECAWEYETEGKTPEEAVAHLYLALNNK